MGKKHKILKILFLKPLFLRKTKRGFLRTEFLNIVKGITLDIFEGCLTQILCISKKKKKKPDQIDNRKH